MPVGLAHPGRRVVLLLAALAIVTCSGSALADPLRDDLVARRSRLLAALDADTMLVAFSAPVRSYSRDIEYEYRQDSNLFYVTGVDQPGTTLVLLPRSGTRSTILFITPRDPAQEHREGRRLSPEQATARSGIETVYLSTQFEEFIEVTLAGRPFADDAPGGGIPEMPFLDAVNRKTASLTLLEDPSEPPEYTLEPARVFAARVRERHPDVSLEIGFEILADLRRVKTLYEQRILRRSVEISSEAHREGMRAARPGRFEYEVEAAVERVFLERGALGWSYPSIVGSGPNATILHYERSRRRMLDGDLLLVDAAASYEYLTGDITRTYPVNGRFSEPQRELYELVLSAQQAAIALATPGRTLSELDREATRVLASGLRRLGLVTDADGEQARLWATHGTVHYIGMDVHDVGDADDPLVPGVAFVIEPGVYVRADVLDRLPSTDETAAFVAAVRPAVARYRDIGVRIEDSFLLTTSGLDRLSFGVPRTVEEIERFMARRHP